eukprot:3054528-Amphidinium_carterae.1
MLPCAHQGRNADTDGFTASSSTEWSCGKRSCINKGDEHHLDKKTKPAATYTISDSTHNAQVALQVGSPLCPGDSLKALFAYELCLQWRAKSSVAEGNRHAAQSVVILSSAISLARTQLDLLLHISTSSPQKGHPNKRNWNITVSNLSATNCSALHSQQHLRAGSCEGFGFARAVGSHATVGRI